MHGVDFINRNTFWQNAFCRNALWLGPIIIALLITPFTPTLDLELARWTYHNPVAGEVSEKYHGFSSNFFFDVMFLFGGIPAEAIGGLATLLLAYSVYKQKYKPSNMTQFLLKFKPWRATALVLSLNLIIGCGIITHTLFKEFWGRPRPRQVEEFGGKQQFKPYYIPALKKPPEPSKSFPSGHSTTGFYFFCIYFLGRRYQKKWLTRLGFTLGAAFGIILSITRIVQGGHFLSDVFFGALIMWETAYFVDWLVFEYLPENKQFAPMKHLVFSE